MLDRSIRAFATAAAVLIVSLTAGGCSVMRGQETAGDYVDDAWITTTIKAKFANESNVSASAISVETLGGVVQLSGFAKSAAEKSRAAAIAAETKGVKSVRNDLIVKP